MLSAEQDMPQPIGSQIRSIRKARGLSLRELALKAGTSAPSMHRYEGGWDGYSFSTLRNIAEALDADLEIRFLPRKRISGDWLTSQRKPTRGYLYEKVTKLFWDRELAAEDLDIHPVWVLKRVLTAGTLEQVQLAVSYYGSERLTEVIQGRGIDEKTRSFWEIVLQRGQ